MQLHAPEVAPARRELLGFAAGLALLPATAGRRTTALEARTVVLVRHAEKAADDPDDPGDPGAPGDPGLSEEGAARAASLARTLAAAGVTHLLATPYRRTRDTLAPLAEATGVAVEAYDPRALGELAERLRALPAGSVAVVAGHSNTTPALAELLGGALSGLDARGFLAEDEHDRLIVQTLAGAGDGAEPTAVATLDLRLQ